MRAARQGWEDQPRRHSTSTHAAAFRDPRFQAEWSKDGVSLCANCHAPLLNQQPFDVKGSPSLGLDNNSIE